MKAAQKIKSPITAGVAKVPVVMQMEALECGAASLAMILAYYEKWVPLEQVRLDCGVSRDGSNARNILRAARSYGLTAKGYRYEPEGLKANGKFPCIIHWNFNHFVVLNGFRGNKAVLNDPAKGTYSVPMQTFDDSFTGICLFFEPAEGFVPEGKPQSMLQYAKKRLAGAGTAIAFVTLTTVISSLLGIVTPAFSRIFLDRLLTSENPEWLMPFTLALAGISVLQLIVAWIQAVYSLRINGKLAMVGNTTFLWKVLHMPMAFFSQRMAGDIQGRQSANAMIAEQLVGTLAPLALNAAMMVFYLVVMLRYSVLLTLIGLVSILANLVLSSVISKKRINLTRVQMRDAGKLAGTTVAGIEMIETIKASGAENGFFEKWAGYQASVNTSQVRFQRMNQLLGLLPALVSSICSTAVLMTGVFLAMQGCFTVGMIMAFQGFLSSFLSPATTLISAGQTLQEMRTDMERIEDVMRYPDDDIFAEDGGDESTEYGKLSGSIELNNVSFRYNENMPLILDDLSLKIRPGQYVAIVGRTGCGKSTLLRLLLGFEKPQKGAIYYDGKDLERIDLRSLRRRIGVVMQNGKLFQGDIYSNIVISAPWLSQQDAWEAAELTGIAEDIRRMPMGMNTVISKGSGGISGGQRQRLMIARAIAPKPKILMFDEATSALDNITQKKVSESLDRLKCTRIVIAHRLSTIRQCDRILVLDHGRIVEDGTYDELIAASGFFAELVARQRLDDAPDAAL